MNRNGKQSEDRFGKKNCVKRRRKEEGDVRKTRSGRMSLPPTGALAPDVHYLKRPFLHSKTSVEMVFRLYLRRDSIFTTDKKLSGH